MTPREFAIESVLARVPGPHTLQAAVTAATTAIEVTGHSENSSSRVVQFAMLCSFVGTFVLTRLVVRMIRSGRGPFKNVAVGDVHVHHLVPGIVIMLVTGPVEFVIAPHGNVRIALACVFAALRLAKPGSPWFSRFYSAGSQKYEKAIRRSARINFEDRVKKWVSGMPAFTQRWHRD